MKLKHILVSLFFVSVCAFAVAPADTPSSHYTPEVKGAFNPDITQSNLMTTVCVPGYTKTIRPPASYTNRLKAEQMKKFSLPGDMKDYEEDHLVPLAVGGHPTDPNNLWPEPWKSSTFGAHQKDRLESDVHRDLCSGKITLEQARSVFLGDVRKEYIKRYGSTKVVASDPDD